MNVDGIADNTQGLTDRGRDRRASYHTFHLPESTSLARVSGRSGVL